MVIRGFQPLQIQLLLAAYNFRIMADSTTYGLLIQCEEQLAEMADLKIPCATLQSLLNLLINQVPSLTADESVKRAREFLELLEKRRAQ